METMGTNFVEIESSEMVTKVARLALDKGDVSVWNKGESSVSYRAMDSQVLTEDEKQLVSISLFSEDEDVNFMNKEILFSFSVMNVDYFGEGKFSKKLNSDYIAIELGSTIFRSEKRGSERLLVFPHHQVYAYFKVSNLEKELDNVVNLSEIRSSAKKEKKTFDRISETGTIQASQLQADENQDVVGFRVLDLANNGISFLTNLDQKKFFIEERIFDTLLLMFDGEAYDLKNGLLIYNVDYVSGKNSYKLGVKFDTHQKLSEKLKKSMNTSAVAQTIRHDFEEFVDE